VKGDAMKRKRHEAMAVGMRPATLVLMTSVLACVTYFLFVATPNLRADDKPFARPQPRHTKGRPVPTPWLGFGHDDHASIAGATYLRSADAIRAMPSKKGRGVKLSYPKSTGLRIVGTGHSWMRPAYRTLPLIAEAAGIKQHLRTNTRGGEAGGARMMWEYENGILSSKGKPNPVCLAAITTGKWDVMTWGGYTDDRVNYYLGWIEFCLKHNPEMHFYRFNGWPQWAHGFGENDRAPRIENYRKKAAVTHERSVKFYAELEKLYPGKMHILPTNEAMLGALELYFQGRLPGVRGLNRRTDGVSPSIWSDGGHLGAGMDLLEGYVFYATLYKRSPELIKGNVQHKHVSPALDKVFRRIAWQAVVNNPLTGVVDKNSDGIGELSTTK
jgi:hypothetical protein